MAATIIVALVLMATQDRCPAHLDSPHDADVTARQKTGLPVVRAMPTEDVGQFGAVRRPLPTLDTCEFCGKTSIYHAEGGPDLL